MILTNLCAKKATIFRACAAIGALLPQIAFAEIDKCRDVLVPSVSTLVENYTSISKYLGSIDASNYDRAKNGLSVAIPDLFSGSFDQFTQKTSSFRNSVSSEHGVWRNTQETLAALPDAAVEAWTKCMGDKKNAVELTTWIHRFPDGPRKRDEVFIAISWQSSDLAELRIKDVVADGAEESNELKKLTKSSFSKMGEIKYVKLTRKSPSDSINGHISGVASGKIFTSPIYVPPIPERRRLTIRVKGEVYCTNRFEYEDERSWPSFNFSFGGDCKTEITNFRFTVMQLVGGKECVRGETKPGSQNFPTPKHITGSRPQFVEVFQGGSNLRGRSLVSIHVYPQIVCE